jgi:hypothetical protein
MKPSDHSVGTVCFFKRGRFPVGRRSSYLCSSTDHDLAAARADLNTLATAVHFLMEMTNVDIGPLDMIASHTAMVKL